MNTNKYQNGMYALLEWHKTFNIKRNINYKDNKKFL